MLRFMVNSRLKKLAPFCLFFCWLLLGKGSAQAASLEETQSQALQHYQKGEFAQAADLYLQLIEAYPDHASLYHNLGSALYRNGEEGAAVAAYLRATQLRPRDPDFKYNLNFLLARNTDKLEARLPGEFSPAFFLAEQLSTRELFYLSLISLLLFAGVGTWLSLRRLPGSTLFASLTALGGLALYLGLSLAVRIHGLKDWGAVQASELAAYSSPTEKNAVQIFRLHQGAPFAVLEVAGDWFKIGLSDQKTGWVLKNQLVVFGPSLHIYKRLEAEGDNKANAKASLP